MLGLFLLMSNAWCVLFDVKCLVCAFDVKCLVYALWCQMLGLCLMMPNAYGLCLNMMLNAWSVHYDSKCLVCALWCQKLGVCLVIGLCLALPILSLYDLQCLVCDLNDAWFCTSWCPIFVLFLMLYNSDNHINKIFNTPEINLTH